MDPLNRRLLRESRPATVGQGVILAENAAIQEPLLKRFALHVQTVADASLIDPRGLYLNLIIRFSLKYSLSLGFHSFYNIPLCIIYAS